jgi:hypothetical protein
MRRTQNSFAILMFITGLAAGAALFLIVSIKWQPGEACPSLAQVRALQQQNFEFQARLMAQEILIDVLPGLDDLPLCHTPPSHDFLNWLKECESDGDCPAEGATCLLPQKRCSKEE